MQSFRTELENPVVEQEILDLEQKIRKYQEGEITDEKFRSLRLARGIYGQRQPGVQMIRIKIPYGRMTARQLRRIADIAEEYGSGNLHATTRQDIQIHYVSLDRTPELWAKLEAEQITLREACGNTVRNVTASATAGIDPKEPFDVSPYAHSFFTWFLRNPVCQEMGRKIKIAFSSSDDDSAFTFFHDIGFLPRVKEVDGQVVRGFRVVVGGGLGAIPYPAEEAFDFLETDQIIPFAEALLRVFDRYGERNRRMKARLKFLLQEIGLTELLRLVAVERKALKAQVVPIEQDLIPFADPQPEGKIYPQPAVSDLKKYDDWFSTNVFEQKQPELFGVYLKVQIGDISSKTARLLADIVEEFTADDIRVTVNQGFLLRSVRPEALPALFEALEVLGLAAPGFDSATDITACPGTDTCNLGISSSTGIARKLEEVMQLEFPDLIHNWDIKIKISGCPNSCAQHAIASIGFHGSSLKTAEGHVLPALQVLLGGRVAVSGSNAMADKVIKVPSKRGPDVLRVLFTDYEAHALEGEYFADYYQRAGGKNYFYTLLRPLADLKNVAAPDFIDWYQEERFLLKTEVGECAGVIIDLVATLLFEAEEKLGWAHLALKHSAWADAIYHAYSALIHSAKAVLLRKNGATNTQALIMEEFQRLYIDTGEVNLGGKSFPDFVQEINHYEPSETFAQAYVSRALAFHQVIFNLQPLPDPDAAFSQK